MVNPKPDLRPFSIFYLITRKAWKKNVVSWYPLHKIQLHSINDQYCIFTSEGDDPHFVIPFKVRPIIRSAIRLKITVPLETFVNIYFKNGIFQQFSENRSLRFKLRPGTHDLIMELPGKGFPGAIRIDHGDVPGKYIIHRLEMGT